MKMNFTPSAQRWLLTGTLWLLWLVLACAILLAATHKARAQFGVEQPMFQMTSTAETIPTQDLQIWLKPESLTNNYTADGEAITNWPDSSGLNHHAIQLGVSFKLTNNILDGFPIAALGRATFSTNGGTNVLNSANGISAYCVGRHGGNANQDLFVVGKTNDAQQRFHWRMTSTSQQRAFATVPDNATLQLSDSFALTADATTVYFLCEVVANFQSQTVSFYTNGVLSGTDSTFATGPLTTPEGSTAVTLCFASAQLNYYICEFIMYKRALTGQERTNVLSYLKEKFPSIPIIAP